MDTPDDCPVHELARTDPGTTVQIYDEYGRYVGPSSAELACEGHHVGAYINRQLATVMAVAMARFS
jgi:hypothetical protein